MLKLTPLSTTASDPTITRSTRSITYATALSRTTVHGIPASVSSWYVFRPRQFGFASGFGQLGIIRSRHNIIDSWYVPVT